MRASFSSGMSYPMLKEIVDKMRLNLPDSRIRTMFNLMDVNHDKSLDLHELLGGFELLFGKLIPDLVFEAVGVSTQHQLKVITTSLLGLVVFFMFIGLAFSSFVVRSYTNRQIYRMTHRRECRQMLVQRCSPYWH